MVSFKLFIPVCLVLRSRCVRLQEDEGHTASHHEGKASTVKMHFWTWNSDEKDMADTADSLVKSIPDDVEVLVTCQQEGKEHIGDEIEVIHVEVEEGRHYTWVPVAGGAHWGKANSGLLTGMDAQLMRVFIKSYDDDKVLVSDVEVPKDPEPVDQSAVRSILSWGVKAAVTAVNSVTSSSHYAPKIVTNAATGEIIMQTASDYVTTSALGKGGVVASVTYKSLTTQVACMHLDAWRDDSREQGLQQAADKLDALGGYDGRFILGDLNYRLLMWEQAITEEYLDKIYNVVATYKEPQNVELFKAVDPLSEKSIKQAKLIRIDGYKCNAPYANYPPTYKLKDPEACANPDTADKAKACYAKLPESDGDRPGYLQLGWLDRLCVHPTGTTKVDFVEDKALLELTGSDHRAVSWTVMVSAE